MIDENKLVMEIANWQTSICPEYKDRDKIIWEVLQEVIEAIDEQPKTGGWIPCSERLPDDLVPVNITFVNRNPESYYSHIKDQPFTATAVFYKGKWNWWSDTVVDYLSEYAWYDHSLVDDAIEILAWQPLPVPYKEGKENGRS